MFLLSKILLKFTPKFNKLYLTTKKLFKANFTPNCTTYSLPRVPSNGLATIALFLCNK